jgi:hypothetical protein
MKVCYKPRDGGLVRITMKEFENLVGGYWLSGILPYREIHIRYIRPDLVSYVTATHESFIIVAPRRAP